MAKVEGKETVEIEAPEEGGKLIDLMAALEASVNAAKASREASSDEAGVGVRRQGRQGGQGHQVDCRSQGQGRRRRRGRGARQTGTEAQDGLALCRRTPVTRAGEVR